jgi:hypothetical protein
MDALKKAIMALWRYIDLVEKDHANLRIEVNAIGDLLMRYLGEIKIEETHNPNIIVAMMKVLRTFENTANHLARTLCWLAPGYGSGLGRRPWVSAFLTQGRRPFTAELGSAGSEPRR